MQDVECRLVSLEHKGEPLTRKLCQPAPREKCVPVPFKVSGSTSTEGGRWQLCAGGGAAVRQHPHPAVLHPPRHTARGGAPAEVLQEASQGATTLYIE